MFLHNAPGKGELVNKKSDLLILTAQVDYNGLKIFFPT